LIWLYMTGEWPSDDIDHRDRDGLNNRWANLREATRSQNLANRCAQVNNAIGVKGVCLERATGRYLAYIKVAGRTIALGRFGTAEEASRAYMAAALQHFGEFARKE
jgi:hypothetical protein